jgi:hypothetical protein
MPDPYGNYYCKAEVGAQPVYGKFTGISRTFTENRDSLFRCAHHALEPQVHPIVLIHQSAVRTS